MGASLGGGDEQPIAEINVVPLVDIILVVLIIFMVTAPLVMKPSIDVNLPKAASGDESPPTPLTIALGRDGEVALNGQPSNLTAVAAFATQLAKEKPDVAAILEADKSVTLDRLTELIDVVKAAGVKKVAFSTQRK